MLKYRFDVMAELNKIGLSSYTLRKKQILGESTMTKLRHAAPISWDNIDTICRLLQCQPGELLQWVPDDDDRGNNNDNNNDNDLSSNNT